MVIDEKKTQDDDGHIVPKSLDTKKRTTAVFHVPTDFSDTTESEGEKEQKCATIVHCPSSHEGRQIMNEVVPIHIDQLFTLLFTNSTFFFNFHTSRKSTDLTQTPWTHNSSDNSKKRIVNLTMALNQAMGPKTAQVTESQTMLPCSKAGSLYAIDGETVNAGIPYADSFFIVVHHCLQKISENESSYQVFAQVNYRKSVWGFVKGMIEKTCWSGLEDFYTALSKALHAESEGNICGGESEENFRNAESKENICEVKQRRRRRKRKSYSIPRPGVNYTSMIVFTVLILLVILNIILYIKLWSLEESSSYILQDLHVLKNPPKSHDEWIQLLQQRETFHSVEIQKWQRILKTSIQLLEQTEKFLSELQRSINPTYTNKVMSLLQNHEDAVEQNRQEEL